LLLPGLYIARSNVSHGEGTFFIILAGPGGGTAPGIGEALIKSGLVTDIAYENLSVGGGGRAIAKLIETAERQPYSSTQRP
jgi:putative tricarboxylic transport membrane protein